MVRRWISRTGWTLLVLVLTVLFALLNWEPFLAAQPGAPPGARAYKVEVIRDEWGVPHIQGATDPDVAFGVA